MQEIRANKLKHSGQFQWITWTIRHWWVLLTPETPTSLVVPQSSYWCAEILALCTVVCMCVLVHECACMHTHVDDVGCLSPSRSMLCFETGALFEPGDDLFCWLISSPRGSPISVFPRLGLQVPVPAEVACSARTLLTHLPSLWPVHCYQLLLVLRFLFWPVWYRSTWCWFDRHLLALPPIFKWQILGDPVCLAAPYW